MSYGIGDMFWRSVGYILTSKPIAEISWGIALFLSIINGQRYREKS